VIDRNFWYLRWEGKENRGTGGRGRQGRALLKSVRRDEKAGEGSHGRNVGNNQAVLKVGEEKAGNIKVNR